MVSQSNGIGCAERKIAKMTDAESGTPDYTMGFSEEFIQALRRYAAETHARHLLPHLKPGQRVLDLGCGPGTISVGLAKAVEPGELYGVDMEESQVELAKAIAQSDGQDNATFQVGDVLDLPFEDDFFDVAHFHNVLMHVPDTAAALREARRVLKSGGLVSAREMIGESSFTAPDFGVIRKAWDMFEDLLAADDGHPQMGKEMKTHFIEAGFTDVRTNLSFDVYDTPEDVIFIYGIAQLWFLSPEITEAAIKYGASTQKLCDDIGIAYERWKDHPGALCGVGHGELIAVNP